MQRILLLCLLFLFSAAACPQKSKKAKVVQKPKTEVRKGKPKTEVPKGKRKTAHQKTQPELTETDTPETLEETLKSLEETIRNNDQQIGGIKEKLDANQKHSKEKKDLQDEANEKKQIHEKWDRLNQLIGDSTGNKFRKIAQSFVLGNLVTSAISFTALS